MAIAHFGEIAIDIDNTAESSKIIISDHLEKGTNWLVNNSLFYALMNYASKTLPRAQEHLNQEVMQSNPPFDVKVT